MSRLYNLRSTTASQVFQSLKAIKTHFSKAVCFCLLMKQLIQTHNVCIIPVLRIDYFL